MKTFQSIAQLRQWRDGIRDTVGCVPTMGALHPGHLSLIAQSRSLARWTVATVFVNPTQFAPGEDFERYPRTLKADLAALEQAGVDAVFTPDTAELYPPGYSTAISPPKVAADLEGSRRPGHFAGVCEVVLKLLNIVRPNVACFGRKDYQQYLVIRRMAADLNVPTRIHACETIREADGLAMSSRNRYLSDVERRRAAAIPRSLLRCRQAYHDVNGGVTVAEAVLGKELQTAVDSIDYAVIRRADDLEPPRSANGRDAADESLVALVAVRIGSTRLIDNLDLTSQPNPQPT